MVCLLALCSAPALALDDHGDTCGTATAITANGVGHGVIVDPVTDEDWLSFSAVAGHRYEATTFVASTNFNYRAEVIAPDCTTVLATWDYYSPDERSVVTSTTDTYYVRIASTAAAYVGFIELGLTDEGVDIDDHSGGRAGATPILSNGMVIAGVTDYLGDVDWFKFTGVGQHLYRMEVRAMPTATTWYVAAGLYQGIGTLGATGWSTAPALGPAGDWVSAVYYVPAGPGGDLQVRVNGWPDLTGPYEVRVTDQGVGAGDEHGNTCGTATAITADGSVTSVTIDPGTDEDWLSVSVVAGNRYQLTTLLPSGVFYQRTQLIDDDCTTVLGEWVYAYPDELSIVATATTTYYLKVTSASGTDVGHVDLGVTDRGLHTDDHSGRQAAATAAPSDGTVQNGTIHYPGDYDFFSFSALADHLYSVQVRALTHTDSWTAATVLYDGPYQLDFSSGSNGGPGGPGLWSGMVYGVPSGSGGTHYVLVYAGSADTDGSYEMTITDLGLTPADDHANDFTSATALLTDGTPDSGVLGYSSDNDWFKFTAVPQRVYAIEVKALISPDSGLAGGSLYATDGTTYLGFAGWSYSAPTFDGDWARVLYYVPALDAGDYFINVTGYSYTAGNYKVRVILGVGLPGDFDADGVPDSTDNCPTVFNPDQADADNDGVGDCCDPDAPDQDNDDVSNSCDNCPTVYNPSQADTDLDGIGDACEAQAPCCHGDMNNDGQLNSLDIQGFVDALLNGQQCPP